jgi:hypothetical protein
VPRSLTSTVSEPTGAVNRNAMRLVAARIMMLFIRAQGAFTY